MFLQLEETASNLEITKKTLDEMGASLWRCRHKAKNW